MTDIAARGPAASKSILLTAYVLACLLMCAPALAQDEGAAGAPAAGKAAASPLDFDLSQGAIKVTADKLVAVRDENMAEFSGHVKAVQGDTVIQSRELRIWWAGSGEPSAAGLPSTQQLERIQAAGDVSIVSPQFRAKSQQADYSQETGGLVLTGEPAQVDSGGNTVTAQTIIRTRRGKLTFEGQVAAQFQPEEDQAAEAPAEAGGE